MNIDTGVLTVIGELRELVTQKDKQIAELVKVNNDLAVELKSSKAECSWVKDLWNKEREIDQEK